MEVTARKEELQQQLATMTGHQIHSSHRYQHGPGWMCCSPHMLPETSAVNVGIEGRSRCKQLGYCQGHGPDDPFCLFHERLDRAVHLGKAEAYNNRIQQITAELARTQELMAAQLELVRLPVPLIPPPAPPFQPSAFSGPTTPNQCAVDPIGGLCQAHKHGRSIHEGWTTLSATCCCRALPGVKRAAVALLQELAEVGVFCLAVFYAGSLPEKDSQSISQLVFTFQ